MTNTAITPEAVRQVLSELKDPETGRTLGKTDQVGAINVSGDKIDCEIKLCTHSFPIRDEFADSAAERLRVRFPAAATG